MTRDEAEALYDSGLWESMTARERAEFQLFTPLLCMPFSVFHAAMEETLGRPVWTHEFGLALDDLRKELLGQKPPPTMTEIIELIPAEKRLLIVVDRK